MWRSRTNIVKEVIDLKKYEWTLEEEISCCKQYINISGLHKEGITFEDIVREVKTLFTNVEEDELVMKLKEIKHISAQYFLFDGLPIEPLEQHSRQCEIALKAALGEVILENELKNHPKPRKCFDENVDSPMICQDPDDSVFKGFFADDCE